MSSTLTAPVASKPIAARDRPAPGLNLRVVRRGWAVEAAGVVVGYLVAALAVTWPLVRNLDGRIYGYPGDSTGTIAFLWLLAEKTGYHVIGSTEMTLTGAPFGWEYANALNIQWAAVVFPAVLLTEIVGEIVAYNVAVLAGLVLSSCAMYLLVRRLGASALVAAWSGLVFLLFPWHLEKAQGHATLVHLEAFPLLVLAVLAWHRQPSLVRALLIGAATLLAWLISGYFGVIAFVAAAVLLLAATLLRTPRPWKPLALAAAITTAVPLAIGLLSLLGASGEGVSGERGVGELSTYGARTFEYVIPSYRNPVFGDDVDDWLGARLHGSNFSETSLYLGWLTLALAVGFVIWAARRRTALSPAMRFAAVALPVLVVVGFVFSLPSPLSQTEIPAPSQALWELLPQFRVPSRFVVLVMAALVPLAALGLEQLRRRVGGLGGVALVLAAFVFSGLELWVDADTSEIDRTPAYYQAVRRAPEGILAEYPLTKSDQGANSEYLFWQRKHGRPIVNSAAGGTFAEQVGQALIDPVSPETPSSLAALGVTAVVVRPNTYAFSGTREGPRELGSGYRLSMRDPSGTSVWRVVAAPAPAIATFEEGFSHAESPVGQPTSRWMIASEAEVDVYAWRPGVYLARFLVASYGRPRIVRLAGANTFELIQVNATRTVTIPVRLPKGRSMIRLSARPGPEPVPDGREVTVYVSNWRFLPPDGASGEPLAAFEAQ